MFDGGQVLLGTCCMHGDKTTRGGDEGGLCQRARQQIIHVINSLTNLVPNAYNTNNPDAAMPDL